MSSTVDELLNQVLYQNKKKVRDDISKLVQHTSTLLPRLGVYTNINGDQSTIVVVYGTLPIYFSSVQYNIPVEILVPHKYPFEAPKLYVRPTPTMAIEENHNYVDMNGLVMIPYLYDWKSSSHLIGLADDFSLIFSAEPPLYSIDTEPVEVMMTTAESIDVVEPAAVIPESVEPQDEKQSSLLEPWNSSTRIVHHDIPLNSTVDTASPSHIPMTNSKTYRGSASAAGSDAAAGSADEAARSAKVAEATRRIRDELFSIQASLLADMDVSTDKKLEDCVEEALDIMKMSLLNNLLQFQNQPQELVLLTKLQQFSAVSRAATVSTGGSVTGTVASGTSNGHTSKGRSPVRHGSLPSASKTRASDDNVVPPPPPPPMASDEFSTLETSNFVPYSQLDDRSITNDTVRSNGPSSISELLEQGQNAGRYAQMLREILRKMSRDDSKVQLKSLEQVLRLGQSIAAVESSALAEKAALHNNSNGRIVSPEKKGSPERQGRSPPPPPSTASRLNLMAESRLADSKTDLVQQTPARPVVVVAPRSEIVGDSTSKDKFATPATAVYKQTKVPGHIPSGAKKNKINKVFGHPAS